MTAYVGIGSNLGTPRAQVLQAFDELAQLPDTCVSARSGLYRSAPQGYADQADFVNAVARLETALEPLRLLRELQAIEERHGRVRSFPNAPRTLDLDLLLYGETTIQEPDLVVPHPRMHERRFVLEPLGELAPSLEVPRLGKVNQLLKSNMAQKVERIP